MNIKWFKPKPETLEDLKKMYRRLAKENHPDLGGNTENMKAINNEYETLFETLKNIHKNAEGETYTSRTETSETAREFMDIIEQIIHMDGIDIEICGSWLWITGNTYQYKDELKALSFRWSGKKKAWYYHRENYKKLSKKTFSLDDIRNMYGSEKIDKKGNDRIAIPA